MNWFEDPINAGLVMKGQALGLDPEFYVDATTYRAACQLAGEQSVSIKAQMNLAQEIQMQSEFGMYAKLGSSPAYVKSVKTGANLAAEIKSTVAMSGLVPDMIKQSLKSQYLR